MLKLLQICWLAGKNARKRDRGSAGDADDASQAAKRAKAQGDGAQPAAQATMEQDEPAPAVAGATAVGAPTVAGDGAPQRTSEGGEPSSAPAQQQRPHYSDEHTVFIKGLGYDVGEKDLRGLLSSCGTIKTVRIPTESGTDRPRVRALGGDLMHRGRRDRGVFPTETWHAAVRESDMAVTCWMEALWEG